jgi:phosphotriesterase-related protein
MKNEGAEKNKKTVITTVTGDIALGDLGFCQSHEHLWTAGYPGAVNPDLRIDDGEKSRAELECYRLAGGAALVDAQPPGCGRNALMLGTLSEQSAVRIIASTGFHKMIYYPEGHRIYRAGADTLTRLFLEELSEGMYTGEDTTLPDPASGVRTSRRAGQIKAALDAGAFGPQYEKCFTAAAEAARASGAPLMVHIEKGSDPLALADFLARRGLAPERLIFCHLDRAVADLAVHRELCRRGIYLEYDTIGRPKYHDDEYEAGIILDMVRDGYAGQLLMSLDSTRARLSSYGGRPGLDHILVRFIPLLRRRGVPEDRIQAFFRDNPARAFGRPASGQAASLRAPAPPDHD